VTIGTETATSAAEASSRAASTRRRNLLLLAMAAIVAVNALAFLAFPPQPPTPGGDYQFPVDAIRGNLEPIIPHIVWDPDPSTPPPTSLVAFDVTITNTLFTMWIVMLVAVVLIVAATRRRQDVPGPLQNAVEYAYESLSSFGISLGGPQAKAFVPMFASLFILIILSNWSGLVPPVGKIELLRAPTSDINVTLGLALVSFLTFHFVGIRRLGVGGYVGKFFSLRPFRQGIAAGLISLFVGFMEFFLEFAKPVTLAMRLFGNIFGGELALAVITSLTIAIIPVALVALETFVGFIQALIFSVLTLIFTMLAIEGRHDEEHAPAGELVTEHPSGEIGARADGLAARAAA